MKNLSKVKLFIVFIFVLFIFSSSQLFADDTYWSNFYEKKTGSVKRSYLILSPVFVKSIGTLDKYVPFGAGINLEWIKITGHLMYGFELMPVYFFGKSTSDNSDLEDTEVAKRYITLPLYLKMGLNFEPDYSFNILPYMHFGPCINFLELAEDGVSALGASEYKWIFGATLITGAGVDFLIKVSDSVTLNTGLVFDVNVDIIAGFKITMSSLFKVGMVLNF